MFKKFTDGLKALAKNADDSIALQAKTLYPALDSLVGKELTAGQRFNYGDKLCKVKDDVEPFTLLAGWTPDNSQSLFEVIDEEHTGTETDPIPYDPNMVVYSGKYYTYEEVLYKCIRDSGQPLYTTPDALLNNYFELV